MLVFRRLTQAKERPCAASLRKSLFSNTIRLILLDLVKANTTSKQIALRARIILSSSENLNNLQIAENLKVSRKCVGKWRRRWYDSREALVIIENSEANAALKRAVQDILQDDYRSGRPPTFSDEQVAKIISLASQSPRELNRPVDDWTGRELADEAKRQNIVPSISASRVNAFLKLVDLKPKLHKGWCFTTETDKELFHKQVKEVCELYLNASRLHEMKGIHFVCVDEMTSLQANERRAMGKRPKPGQSGKTECQYTRHGTLSLTGSWDVVAGRLIHSTIAKTRTAEDFAAHILNTIASDPDGEWVLVMDNLNTHYGEPIVRAIAKLLGIDVATLGDKKRRKGILGSETSRKKFLTDPSHRIRFVFIPKHSSWLNQIERVFGVISSRVMRNGTFTSVIDLQEKLASFIAYFNRTFAKPISWKYDGTPRGAKCLERIKTWREKRQPNRSDQILALAA
jgi:transposase